MFQKNIKFSTPVKYERIKEYPWARVTWAMLKLILACVLAACILGRVQNITWILTRTQLTITTVTVSGSGRRPGWGKWIVSLYWG